MSDIVERLREEGFITHMARLQRESKVLHEAADEIDRLRAELAAMRQQRDEARRLYCHAQARIPDGRPEQLAQTLGWDCFEEVQP